MEYQIAWVHAHDNDDGQAAVNAAEQLVEADRVRVIDATQGEDDRTNVLRLQ